MRGRLRCCALKCKQVDARVHEAVAAGRHRRRVSESRSDRAASVLNEAAPAYFDRRLDHAAGDG